MKPKPGCESAHIRTAHFVFLCVISVICISPLWANDPIFRPASFTDSVRSANSIELVDIDNDGDLDLFVGRFSGGGIYFYRNTAMPGREPVFIPDGGREPFGLLDIDGVFSNAPAFVDIDSDGDLDAFVGYGDPSNLGFQIVFYRNVAGTNAEPEYVLEAQENPFGLDAIGFNYQMAFIDIDNDSDQDVFIGLGGSGGMIFYRNVANPGGIADFVAESDMPFGLTNVGRDIAPFFVDIDGDSDVDAFIGTSSIGISFFRNMAGPQSEPEFVLESEESPFGLSVQGIANSGIVFDPVLKDVDHDGDLDALIGLGERNGIGFFRNTAGAGARPIFVQESSYSAFGLTINRTQDPFFVDIEGDGDLDAITGGLVEIALYRNDAGSQPLQNPQYSLEARAETLFGLPLQNFVGIPVLKDMDNDGDLDAIQSFGLGPSDMPPGYYYYENINGPSPRPQFDNSTPVPIPGLEGVISGLLPVFVDIDFDGDLDVFIKPRQISGPEPLRFFRNVASNGMNYVEEGGSSPFGLDPDGDGSPPTFGDLDGDGDLDALTGSFGGQFSFFRNTAGPNVEPVFIEEGGEIPFGLYTINRRSNPYLVDIDSDGDLDVFFGVFVLGTEFMRNVLNKQPAFSIGPDLAVLDNSTSQNILDFITDIEDNDGGVDQRITFLINNDNPSLFSQQPLITERGTLRYRPLAGAEGIANIAVTMMDDGGTENGGIDTSITQNFSIRVINHIVSVSSTVDSGPGTLRQAVTGALPGMIVRIEANIAGQPIVLENPLNIMVDMSINGLGADSTILSGNGRTGIINIAGPARVELNDMRLQNGNMRAGGAIGVFDSDAELIINNCRITGNFASFNGGGINNQGGRITINNTVFFNNDTSGAGGAIHNTAGGQITIRNASFSNNRSNGSLGGAISNETGEVVIESTTIANNTALNFAGGIGNGSSNTSITLRNSIVANNTSSRGNGRDIGNMGTLDSIQSVGGNLIGIVEPASTGNSEGIFIQPTDQTGTLQQPLDPLLEDPVAGVMALLPDSPAIDAGLSGLSAQDELPCGLADIRGLARPQDGNQDGVFECDSGAYELQSGLDIGAAQSAVYFDPARNGEGQVLELLADNRAVVSEFTFDAQGRQLWWTALGERVGNSVVFETVNSGQGGLWGSGFDPARITRTNIGRMAMLFPDCESVMQPGRIVFQAADTQNGLTDLLHAASRLTTVIGCDGQVANPLSARSGSYFSPARSGEGLQYTEQANGSAVMVFYGYTPDGDLFWTTSGPTTVDENVVTAEMFYPAETTVFGSGFNPDDIVREPFGALTLTFGDNETVLIDIQPVVDGFEPVSYTAQRLTTPIGFENTAAR